MPTDLPLSGLTPLTGANLADGDLFECVDVSDTTFAASGTNKKITTAEKIIGLVRLGRLFAVDAALSGTLQSVKVGGTVSPLQIATDEIKVVADFTVVADSQSGTAAIGANQLVFRATGDFSGWSIFDANSSGVRVFEDELYFTSAAGAVHLDISLPNVDPHEFGVLWCNPADGILRQSQG